MSLKKTPLYSAHLSRSAKLIPFAGWEMPLSFSGIIAEHLAVRQRAGVFDISHMGLIKVRGASALSFLQKITTNDVSCLADYKGQYSVICNENGGTLDDLFLYKLPEFYLLFVNASNAEKVFAWLQKNNSGCAIEAWEGMGAISLQGPESLAVAEKVFSGGEKLVSLPRNALLEKGELLFSRTGYTGEEGIEIIAPANKLINVWEELLAAGVVPCGLGARDTLRLEAALPLYGHEYDEETSPLAAGYGWAVKFGKGDFIGRKALLQEKTNGPSKILSALVFNGRGIPRQGVKVFLPSSGKLLGQVTSGTFSPSLGKPIALAYLYSQPTEVVVELRGEKVAGILVDKPFYKRVK